MSVKIVDVPEVLTLGTTAYADDVAAVDESGRAGLLTFPDTAENELKTHIKRLHSSAESIGKSVKILSKTPTDDGVDVLFVVTERVTRAPRKGKTGDDE